MSRSAQNFVGELPLLSDPSATVNSYDHGASNKAGCGNDTRLNNTADNIRRDNIPDIHRRNNPGSHIRRNNRSRSGNRFQPKRRFAPPCAALLRKQIQLPPKRSEEVFSFCSSSFSYVYVSPIISLTRFFSIYSGSSFARLAG